MIRRPLSRGIGVALAIGAALGVAVPSAVVPSAAVAAEAAALNWVTNTASDGPSEETLIADPGPHDLRRPRVPRHPSALRQAAAPVQAS